MSLNEDERAILVQREFAKAQQFYKEAEMNASIELWDVVSNRLYYAVFHAVCALLVKSGLQVSSHKGAVLMFGRHFVQTGIFETSDGRFYSQLQSMREKSDYNCYWQTTKEDVADFLPKAAGLLARIRPLLSPYLD